MAPSSSLLWDSLNELHNDDLENDVGGVASSVTDGSQDEAAELTIMASTGDTETSRFLVDTAVALVALSQLAILDSTGDVSETSTSLVGTAVALVFSVVLRILDSTGETSETSEFSVGSAARLLSKVSS